ncbi:hypothetical protein L6R50_26680 [Myxococcota bacterium]|nr:hypothetical protein [Myxococcota bacterium]
MPRTPALVGIAAAATLALSAPPAVAGWPEDVTVQNLASGGVPYGSSEWQSVFNFVAREMAMVIGPKALGPAETLGLYGSEIGFETSVAFPHSEEGATDGDGSSVSYWEALTESGTASPALVVPTIRVRKGLPYSFEVGTTFGYLAPTRQAVVGGYGRWSFAEGWRKVPDVAITFAYNGYVGNEQLDLGVLLFDLTVGYTFAFGIDDKYAGARFSPFVGWGHGTLHARPKNLTGAVAERVLPISGFSDSGLSEVDPETENPKGIVDTREFQFDKFFFGFSIQSGNFSFLIDAELVVPRGVHSVSTRFAVPF